MAKALRVQRIGGPGKPDFILGGRKGENKHWLARRVHAGVIQDAHRKGFGVVNASGRKGFTRGARKLAKELGIRLLNRKR